MERIVGGNEAQVHSINFQVSLNVETNDGPFRCGGSLISPSYVLTAAHCLVFKPPNQLKSVSVVVGEHDTKVSGDEEGEFKVAQIINHPDYNHPNVGKTTHNSSSATY